MGDAAVSRTDHSPPDATAVRWAIAFDAGRSLAEICFQKVRIWLLLATKRDKAGYDACLRTLECGLGQLWPNASEPTVPELIGQLQTVIDNERQTEWLCDLERQAIESYQRQPNLALATESVAGNLRSTLHYVELSVQSFVEKQSRDDPTLYNMFLFGQALWECEFPSRNIPQFARMDFEHPTRTIDRRRRRGSRAPGCVPRRAPMAAGQRPAEPPQPQLRLVVDDHRPGSIAVSDATIETVLRHLDRVSPPLDETQRTRLARIVTEFRGRSPIDAKHEFEAISRRLREFILPSSEPGEVEWSVVRVNRETSKLWWGDRTPLPLSDQVALRLLYLLLAHRGRIKQAELVEKLWKDESKVQERYGQLRKVRNILNRTLHGYLGPDSPTQIVAAACESGGKRKHGPDCWVELSHPDLPAATADSAPVQSAVGNG